MFFGLITTYLRVKGLVDDDMMTLLFIFAMFEIIAELYISTPLLLKVL